jgi:glycosyltransferase involved in cell wall biosynthesis
VATLLAQARALLFPSFVEGYGLPPLEAASLGVAVIVPPLPIYLETLGDYPVYANLDDSYSWMETIIQLKDGRDIQGKSGAGRCNSAKHTLADIPQWDAHFKIVLTQI